MSADDYIYVFGIGCYVAVGVARLMLVAISYVCQSHHNITFLIMFQVPRRGIGGFYPVQIFYACGILVGYHSFWVNVDGHEAHFLVTDFLYGVRLEKGIKFCA